MTKNVIQISKLDFKKIVVIICFSLLYGILFGQKILDHKLFLEKIKHSSDNIYKDCIKEYDTYLDKFPHDVSVLIEKCKFIQYAQFNEEEYCNPNQAAFDSCSIDIINRFPTRPEVLLFQTTYLWGDELEGVFKNAEKSIKENLSKWENTDIAALYNTMADYYYNEDDSNQAIFYIEKAIWYDEQYKFSLKYARILLESGRKEEALAILISIPDTTKNIWELVQKANLLLDLNAYSNALDIYNQVEQMDSLYINNVNLASTLEGMEQYELARKYLVADTAKCYGKEATLIKLLNHDFKYQDGSKCIASYNALRDLGYSSDPISLYRLKLFLLHPTQAWQFRDLLGLISLLAVLAMLIIIPYMWILPIYFVGKRFKFLSNKNAYESAWNLKRFWFVSCGFLFASLFACVVEPGMLYSIINSSGLADRTAENIGLTNLVFIIIMALFGLMVMCKVNAKVLLSNAHTIGKSILIAVGIFFAFKLISGIYVLSGAKIFNISMDELANVSKIVLMSKQDITAMVSVLGKGGCILLIGFLGPIYEEIIFRGVILDSCQRYINFNVANIFQALLFASIHGSFFLFPVFFLFGILVGIMRKKSGGLLPCIVFHILNNVVVMAFLLVKDIQ